MEYAPLMLSMQIAMLGMVTPNLRAIYIRKNGKEACLYFYYDNPPLDDEEELASIMHTEVISDFVDYDIDFKVCVLPYPQLIPKDGWCAYSRYEKNQP